MDAQIARFVPPRVKKQQNLTRFVTFCFLHSFKSQNFGNFEADFSKEFSKRHICSNSPIESAPRQRNKEHNHVTIGAAH